MPNKLYAHARQLREELALTERALQRQRNLGTEICRLYLSLLENSKLAGPERTHWLVELRTLLTKHNEALKTTSQRNTITPLDQQGNDKVNPGNTPITGA